MALLASCSRLQRNPQWAWKTVVRPFRVGDSFRLPEKPYWRESENHVRGFDEIPGPKPIFFLGNIWRYWPIVGQYSFLKLHETYSSFYKQYGYVVKEKVHPTRTIVHLYHPEDIMSVFNSAGKYPLRKSHTAMEKYRRERPHLYPSVGLGSSNGEEWFKFRRIFTFTDSEASLIAYQNIMRKTWTTVEDVTDDLVERLGFNLDAKGEIDVRLPLFRWALESIGMITLNRRLGCLDPKKNVEADKLIKAAHATHDAIYQVENRMSPLVRWREHRRLVEAQDFFSDVIRKYMFQSIADSHGKEMSLLTAMLENKTGTTRDIFTLILDFFQGGIHAVSYSVCFALLHLALNKDKQDKLRQHLMESLPTPSSKLRGPEGGVKYVHEVFEETLRLNPPSIGTGRILNQDLVLGGYNVPAGTMVILQNQVASMQPEFFKDPHLFNPERWSDGSKDLGVEDEVGRFACMPFGFGARGCIASRFARMELELAISKIVRNYEISYHHQPIGTVNKLHNEPDKPVLLRLKKVRY